MASAVSCSGLLLLAAGLSSSSSSSFSSKFVSYELFHFLPSAELRRRSPIRTLYRSPGPTAYSRLDDSTGAFERRSLNKKTLGAPIAGSAALATEQLHSRNDIDHPMGIEDKAISRAAPRAGMILPFKKNGVDRASSVRMPRSSVAHEIGVAWAHCDGIRASLALSLIHI